MRLFRAALISLAVTLMAVGDLSPIAAADSTSSDFSLTTSPVYATLTTQPQQAVSTPIKVFNNAAKPVDLDVKLLKFRASGGAGQAELLNPSPNDPSISWVSFSRTSLTAQPGVWNTVTMTIKPSATASFGYYYAVVFAQAGTSTTDITSHNRVNGSTAVLVLLDVQVPGEKRQLQVSDFSTEHKVYEFLPANFTVTVKNTGNVHVVPAGDIYISRDKHTDIATLPINDSEGNVLPDSSRSYTVTWDDGFPAHTERRVNGQVVSDKSGKPQTVLNWDASRLNKFRFGKYYAHMLLVYNNGTQDVPIESEVAFWVIPWKVLLVLFIIIVLLLVGLVTVGRRLLKAARTTVRPDSSQKE